MVYAEAAVVSKNNHCNMLKARGASTSQVMWALKSQVTMGEAVARLSISVGPRGIRGARGLRNLWVSMGPGGLVVLRGVGAAWGIRRGQKKQGGPRSIRGAPKCQRGRLYQFPSRPPTPSREDVRLFNLYTQLVAAFFVVSLLSICAFLCGNAAMQPCSTTRATMVELFSP